MMFFFRSSLLKYRVSDGLICVTYSVDRSIQMAIVDYGETNVICTLCVLDI